MKNPNIRIINKPVGITSYDVIRRLKKIYPKQKIGHAGTLDPLASGILICLMGKEATKQQSKFMGLEKEYEFEVLFGFETDTYDVLGLPMKVYNYDPKIALDRVKDFIPSFVGKIKQEVPPFSAVKVNGKPLYRWYLDGRINEVDIPTKVVTVSNLALLKEEIITQKELWSKIKDLLGTVKSGFRQKSITSRWSDILDDDSDVLYLILTLKARVSKGTYVRAIANDLGKKLGVGGCTLNITRTRIGDFSIEEAEDLEDL